MKPSEFYENYWKIDLGNGKLVSPPKLTDKADKTPIADATELMASNYVKLQNDYKFMRESRDRWQADAERLKRSNAALRGHIKRLKHP